MVARREILNTEQVRELRDFADQVNVLSYEQATRALDSHELLRADRDALAEALVVSRRDRDNTLRLLDELRPIAERNARDRWASANGLAVHGSGEAE